MFGGSLVELSSRGMSIRCVQHVNTLGRMPGGTCRPCSGVDGCQRRDLPHLPNLPTLARATRLPYDCPCTYAFDGECAAKARHTVQTPPNGVPRSRSHPFAQDRNPRRSLVEGVEGGLAALRGLGAERRAVEEARTQRRPDPRLHDQLLHRHGLHLQQHLFGVPGGRRQAGALRTHTRWERTHRRGEERAECWPLQRELGLQGTEDHSLSGSGVG